MKNLFLGTAFLVTWAALAAAPARAEEATFTRDLTVTGRVDLTVATGSGSIHLTSGPAGRVHIFARVKSNWGGSDAKVHEIADHPPIEQTGNIVRIGARHESLHNISIDYEIQVPPDAFLNAETGSGNVTDDGVGANAKLNTGSGSIHATGLQGGFTVETGSGSIKAGGTPSAQWRLQTGSGSVEIWTGAAAFTLEAETGSGSIHCDREIASQGTMEHHHLAGKIGGGGPTIRVESGSGNIRIH